MVRGTEEDVDELVRILETFSQSSGIKINWENPCAYWFDKYTHKSKWLLGCN